MTMRFLEKPGIFLIVFLFIVSILPACAWAQTDHKGNRLLGGPCRYKTYPGRATILSITESQVVGSDPVKRFDVQFSFTPQEKIEESFARVEGKTFHLYGNNFQYPDRQFLEANNIKVGRVLDGNLLVITSGTCTPALFDFPILKQRK